MLAQRIAVGHSRDEIGYAASALRGSGLLQLACVVLCVIPRTAVLGTVLLTGYLGGAIASYVRIGEPYPVLVPLSTALLAWLGIYLREERLRSLLRSLVLVHSTESSEAPKLEL